MGKSSFSTVEHAKSQDLINWYTSLSPVQLWIIRVALSNGSLAVGLFILLIHQVGSNCVCTIPF